MGEPEGVPELVRGDGHEVDPGRWDAHGPCLRLVEVRVTRYCTSVRRRVEAVGQDSARAIEGASITVVAAHEPDDDVRVVGDRDLRERQRCDGAPEAERLTDRRTHLRL